MRFSAKAKFVGSGLLAAVGTVTLTKVKHRRELLLASLLRLLLEKQRNQAIQIRHGDLKRLRR